MVSHGILPPLREDLALHPGPHAPDGSPTWTLHDPASNRFFRLGWAAFELLSRWPLGSADRVLERVRRETTLQLGWAELDELLRMLADNHLLAGGAPAHTERLITRAQALRPGPARWLLKNYLSVRLPLVRPMRWLQRVLPWLAWAWHPAFWVAVAVSAGVGLALASRRWDEFTHTFVSYASWEGLLAVGLAMSFAKVLHELGHAFTATRHGCRVPTMGVAFLVMWPVLYTDTNEAWKLTSRRQRLAIGAAGMLTELALAAFALLAWSLLPDTPAWAPVRSAAFLLGTTTWVLTVAINASPFMRFDGYFLLSDAVGLPNLHERAFAQARWWLRERLFGWNDAPPEPFTTARRNWLVAFGFATWAYRFILFMGIALVVYHAFFKALGAALMAVELGWFIGMPVMREVRGWWQRRGAMRWNRSTRRAALLLGSGLIVLFVPWRSTVRAPGVLGAQASQVLYAPYAAQVQAPLPPMGQAFRAGDVLVRLHAPELHARLATAQAREQQLAWQLSQQPFDARLMASGPALRKHWEAASETVTGLQQELQRLVMRAPFDGRVADVADDVHRGSWIPAGERLLHAVSDEGTKADVFVSETALAGLAPGLRAVFVPTALHEPSVVCSLAQVEAVPLANLELPGLASVHGGDIPVRQMPEGQLVPLQPTFRLRLAACDRTPPPSVELQGMALLEGEARSLAMRLLLRGLALWRHEASW